MYHLKGTESSKERKEEKKVPIDVCSNVENTCKNKEQVQISHQVSDDVVWSAQKEYNIYQADMINSRLQQDNEKERKKTIA